MKLIREGTENKITVLLLNYQVNSCGPNGHLIRHAKFFFQSCQFHLRVPLHFVKQYFQTSFDHLHGCTVHVDNIKSFICLTNAQTDYFKIVEILKLQY